MRKPFWLQIPVWPRRAVGPILTLMGLLGGCALGPDFLRPKQPQLEGYTERAVDLSGSGGEAKQNLAVGEKVSGDWWALFRSPQLDQVLQQALADNRTLAAAKATLAQAQDAVAQAGGITKAAQTLHTANGQTETRTHADLRPAPPIPAAPSNACSPAKCSRALSSR